MNDSTFRDRVMVACLEFANFIAAEAPSVAAHPTRYKWAQQTFGSPYTSAQAITPLVVLDPAVQSAGSTITDAALQPAVENAVTKTI